MESQDLMKIQDKSCLLEQNGNSEVRNNLYQIVDKSTKTCFNLKVIFSCDTRAYHTEEVTSTKIGLNKNSILQLSLLIKATER